MAQSAKFVGIDCGKAFLDVAVFPTGERTRVDNDAAGHVCLIGWLAGRDVAVVGIEASGGYERGVRDALEKGDLSVAVLDPGRVRHFAKAKGQRAKTDVIDAGVIADFTAHFQPAATPADPHREGLAGLLGLRRLLVDKRADLTKALARLPAGTGALASPVLAALDTAAEAVESQIMQQAQADAALTAKARTLQSAPGIGTLTALTLAVLMPELGRISGSQAAALLGVAPYPNDSGQHRGARHIAGGRESARRAVYMAVLSGAVRRRKGLMAAFYDRLIARGKPPKVALTACMRKLIVRLNAMLAHGQTWSEEAI